MNYAITVDRAGRAYTDGRLAAALAFLLALSGCGEREPTPVQFKNQEVKGKVVLSNGKPLTKGKVVLWPQQEPMMQLVGKLDSDGGFILKSGGLSVGVSHGEFLVSVEPEGYLAGSSFKPRGLQYPAKYLNDQTSGIKVKITPEMTDLPLIELK